ncbi:MAG: hypothetical protein RR350_03335 [Oscillibacter sp.]
MELKLQNGDYVPDGVGGLRRVDGNEALLQRVLFKLTARRGEFPFREDLGSRLWQLSAVPSARRQGAAEQYVAEALAEETGVRVTSVKLRDLGGGAMAVAVGLQRGGEPLDVTLEVR